MLFKDLIKEQSSEKPQASKLINIYLDDTKTRILSNFHFRRPVFRINYKVIDKIYD